MKKTLQEIMGLILELSEDERRARLLRQMQAGYVDKHWEDYL